MFRRQLEETPAKPLALKNGSGEFGEVDSRLEARDLELAGGGNRGHGGDGFEKPPAQQIFSSIDSFSELRQPSLGEGILAGKLVRRRAGFDVAERFGEREGFKFEAILRGKKETGGRVEHGLTGRVGK